MCEEIEGFATLYYSGKCVFHYSHAGLIVAVAPRGVLGAPPAKAGDPRETPKPSSHKLGKRKRGRPLGRVVKRDTLKPRETTDGSTRAR